MDPVGLTFGAVSLVFQLFAGCIKAYRLLSDARGLEKAYRFYLIRFKAEEFRLLDWATIAELSERDDTGLISKINRAVVINVLDEQYRLLMRFGRLDERLRPLSAPLLVEYDGGPVEKEPHLSQRYPETNELLKKALAFVDATSKYPSRLRWAFCDRTKADELLSRISELNKLLRDLLNIDQLRLLREQEVSTQYQIVQLNTKMDHLIEIVHAGLEPQVQALPGSILDMDLAPMRHGRRLGDTALEGLASMAKLKAVVLSAEDVGAITSSLRAQLNLGSPSMEIPVPKTARLNPADILLDDDPAGISSTGRSAGWYQPPGAPASYRCRVWVEWTGIPLQHYFSPVSGPEARTLRRFEALVSLLRESQQTGQLRALPCLGYYFAPSPSSAQELHYGLVFHNPPGINPSSRPVSLRHLLCSQPNPNLTARLQLIKTLAGCLARLHAVNWLHKGLCSENVLFFTDSKSTDVDVDLAEPYLSGFDYARPASAASLSEAPTQRDLLREIYRHPAVQGQAPIEPGHSGFRKGHDVYSLGLMMTEIAEWRPIDKILMGLLQTKDGGDGKRKLTGRDVLDTRETLLRELAHPGRSRLASFVGGTAARAIWACIEGGVLLKVDREEEGFGGAELQARFYEVVSKPLFGVRV